MHDSGGDDVEVEHASVRHSAAHRLSSSPLQTEAAADVSASLLPATKRAKVVPGDSALAGTLETPKELNAQLEVVVTSDDVHSPAGNTSLPVLALVQEILDVAAAVVYDDHVPAAAVVPAITGDVQCLSKRSFACEHCSNAFWMKEHRDGHVELCRYASTKQSQRNAAVRRSWHWVDELSSTDAASTTR